MIRPRFLSREVAERNRQLGGLQWDREAGAGQHAYAGDLNECRDLDEFGRPAQKEVGSSRRTVERLYRDLPVAVVRRDDADIGAVTTRDRRKKHIAVGGQ